MVYSPTLETLKLLGKGVKRTGGVLIVPAKYSGKFAVKHPRTTILGGSIMAYLNSDLSNYSDKLRAKMMLENNKKGI